MALVAAAATLLLGSGAATADSGGGVPATRADAARLSAGGAYNCFAIVDGSVRCWGANAFGQLGNGDVVVIGDNETPATVPPANVAPDAAIAVAVGEAHTCALLDGGAVRCWGFAGNGQLGYGNTTIIGDNELPSTAGDVPLGLPATAIAAGSFHTCALLIGGVVRCWGLGADGQLGYGNTSSIGDNETPSSAGDVPLGRAATAIAAGSFHTCALLDTGNVRCWGLGSSGQLGYANTNTIGDDETPSHVDVALGGSAVAITTGAAHSCAVLESGSVRCWGLGSSGQLGYGNTNTIGDDDTPASAGNVNIGANATAVSAGSFHTCAVLTGGQVRCWGLATDGRLGYGNLETIGDNETPASAGPVQVGGAAIAVVAGSTHTCAALTDESVRCWGIGSNGRLGYGNTNTIGDDETPASAGAIALPPRNDNFARASTIVGATAQLPGTTASATLEPGEGGCAGSTRSIWYRWSAPSTGAVTIDTVGSRIDTVLSVSTGSSPQTLTERACNDDLAPGTAQSQVSLRVTAGETYRIRVGSAPARPSGRTSLNLQFTADPPPATVFTTATPARFADTRPGGATVDGAFSGAGPVQGGTSYEVQITRRNLVPAGATAAVINLTTVVAAGAGFATAYPCGGSVPTASSVNFGPGGVDPNEVVVKLSATGSLCIYALTTTDVLVDVVGWADTRSAYAPLAPARLADTRANGPTTDDQFSGAGIVRGGSSYEIQATGRAGVLPGAAAAVVNLTVTDAAGPGFATAYPCSGDPTAASSLNYDAGQTVPNELVAKLSPSGSLCVYVLTDAHVIVDVVGFIPAGTVYVPLTPARLADTRAGGPTTDGRSSGAGIVTGGSSYVIPVTGRATVPNSATAAVVNLTVTGAAGPGFATAYPCDGSPTTASSLNYGAGTTRPNELVAKLSATGSLCVYAATDTHVLVDIVGYL